MSHALMKTFSMLHTLTRVATVDVKMEISGIMHKCDGAKQCFVCDQLRGNCD